MYLRGPLYPGQGWGGAGAYPRNTRPEAEIDPGWDSWNLEQAVHLSACFWEVGGKSRTHRKPRLIQREHVILHMDSSTNSGLNQ